MSLLTPIPNDDSSCLPGEGWFLYWRVAPSLWKSKIAQIPSRLPVILPVNWSFHTDDGYQYDFGIRRPEADFVQIVKLCQESSRPCFVLLPFGPVPFLANGGLPSTVVASLSINELGLIQTCISNEGEIHKLFSFFAPQVFQCFARFVSELGKYLSSHMMNIPVYGAEFGYYQNQQFQLFKKDRSVSFEQSFKKFVMIKEEEGFVGARQQLLGMFESTISNLYQEEAEKALNGYLEGNVRVAMLGGSQDDFLARLAPGHVKRDGHYLESLMMTFGDRYLASSILLAPNEKEGVLKYALDSLVNLQIAKGIQGSEYMFKPQHWFQMIGENQSDFDVWKDNGLYQYLEKNQPWSFCKMSISEIATEHDDSDFGYIFCHAGQLTEKNIARLFKAFLTGRSVMIDGNGLSAEILRRIQFFREENGLVTEEVKIGCSVSCTTLGEARFIYINGAELQAWPIEKKTSFWERLIQTLNSKIVPVEMNPGIVYFWRSRASSGSELKFEEVRRLTIFNPTSYKKKFTIYTPKWAYLSKIIDQDRCEVDNKTQEIQGTLSPGGRICLDFGIGA